MEERAPAARLKPLTVVLLGAILAIGIFLRAWPSTGFHGVGYDEHIYGTYVEMAAKKGILNYSDVVHAYLLSQAQRPDAVVPATRVAFLWPAAVLANVGRLDPLAALHIVSLLGSVGLLLATAAIGYRLADSRRMLALSALMAVAPLQIHLAQRSLVDGYFSLWAVLCAWCLWERLHAPRSKGWLAAYGSSLVMLVLTKENAAFVFAAVISVLIIFIIFRFVRVDGPLLLTSFLAPAVAVLVLATLMGGIGEWIAFYKMFVAKSQGLEYAIRFQNGAWYRYLVDFTLLSPCIVALAFGRLFQIGRQARADMFWALLLGFSFFFMSMVTNGMSLRFAAYWDEPLRWLAASQLVVLANRFVRARPAVVLAVAVLILAAVDLSQYWRYFVRSGIYDPVSFQLFHASRLIK